MGKDSDDRLLASIRQLVKTAEAADRLHSTIITRVRLAHAKAMYVRAAALIHQASRTHVSSPDDAPR